MKKKKTPLIIAIVGIVLFILLGVMIRNNNGSNVEKTVSDWTKDVTLGKKVLTVMGLTTCSHCQEYKPVITSLAKKYGINFYFFETDTLTKEELEVLSNTYDLVDFKSQVPFTFIVNNNAYVTGKTGYSDRDDILEFLKENDLIKN